MADTVRVIVVNFNDLAGQDSRILTTLERSATVRDLVQFIQTNYPVYRHGQIRFYLLYGAENKALDPNQTIEQVLSYYVNDIPLLGFLHAAPEVQPTGNLMSTGLTAGDLYWAHQASNHGDKVQRFVLNKRDEDKFPGSIKLAWQSLDVFKPAMTQVGSIIQRKFPTARNTTDNLILLNVPILYLQNEVIPTTYIIGTLIASKTPNTYDFIKGRGGWLMQYRVLLGQTGLLYFYDTKNNTWYQMEGGSVETITQPPRPSGNYLALADVDSPEVRQVIDNLYS